jgi:hypothetical protein
VCGRSAGPYACETGCAAGTAAACRKALTQPEALLPKETETGQ